MVATLGGLLALPLGLAVLLLPLLATELSRPRDSAWGALVLLLGLVLVTSAERLSGAPMLGVLCAALLLGRLAVEVGQGRWRQLSEEEQRRLASFERWSTSFRQLAATIVGGAALLGERVAALSERFRPATGGTGAEGAAGAAGRSRGKRWVRPEPEARPEAQAAPLSSAAASPQADRAGTADPPEAPAATATDQPAAEASAAAEPAAGPPTDSGGDPQP